MKPSTSRTLLAALLTFLFLVRTFPVRAQEGISTETPTATFLSEGTPTADGDLTPTVEPETFTPTAAGSQDAATLTPDPRQSPTPEIFFTQTVTPSFTAASTATPTREKTRPPASCSVDGVFQNQITVNTKDSSLPRLAVGYTVVSKFDDASGNKFSVIQVSSQDYCTALHELGTLQNIEYVEPNYSISTLDTVPNDSMISQQYYLNNILAPRGWDITTGSPAVTIAIIDSGVDAGNLDLAEKLVAGHDFVDKDSTPQDENGHGTFVAGVAAALTNNGRGVAGVSWGAQIMPLRVLDRWGNGSYANAASAIIWATDNGARVINMSFGGENSSQVLEDAVDYALERGVVLTASTGNTGASQVLYPAAFGGVIAVGATDSANQLAGFSNNGGQVDVVAPGVSIVGLTLNNQYMYSSGTSAAAPQVAGYAALLFSMPGVVYSSQVERIIKSTALDLGSSGWDSLYGNGLIQVGPGLTAALSEGTTTPPPTQSPTRRVDHQVITPSATSTVIWYLPGTPEATFVNPFLPTSSTGDLTPTPGEIHMLDNGDSHPSDGLTATPTPENVRSIPSTEEKNDSSRILWIGIGLLCILGFIAVCFHIRSRILRND